MRLTKKAFNKCNSMGKVLAAAGFPNEYNTATFIGYDNLIKPVSLVIFVYFHRCIHSLHSTFYIIREVPLIVSSRMLKFRNSCTCEDATYLESTSSQRTTHMCAIDQQRPVRAPNRTTISRVTSTTSLLLDGKFATMPL